MLEMLDYRAKAVEDGAEALSLASEPPFDVVLSDVVLPGQSGPEVVEQLMSRWPHMKCILMSGYTSDPETRRSIAAGSTLLLDKPFDVCSLAHALTTALARTGPQSS